MSKFWEYLFKLSKRKVRDAHLDKFKNDARCQVCQEWYSITGLEAKHEHVSEPEWGYKIKCGKCEGITFWNAVAAPVLLRCDSKGNPL